MEERAIVVFVESPRQLIGRAYYDVRLRHKEVICVSRPDKELKKFFVSQT